MMDGGWSDATLPKPLKVLPDCKHLPFESAAEWRHRQLDDLVVPEVQAGRLNIHDQAEPHGRTRRRDVGGAGLEPADRVRANLEQLDR
jgi:hypothetical protein